MLNKIKIIFGITIFFLLGVSQSIAFNTVESPSAIERGLVSTGFTTYQKSVVEVGPNITITHALQMSGSILGLSFPATEITTFTQYCFSSCNGYADPGNFVIYSKLLFDDGTNFIISVSQDFGYGDFGDYLFNRTSGEWYRLNHYNNFYSTATKITTDGTTYQYWDFKTDGADVGSYTSTGWQSQIPKQTISAYSGFVLPNSSPVFVAGIGTGNFSGWYYYGIDNKIHYLDKTGTNPQGSTPILGGGDYIPLGIFGTSISGQNLFNASQNINSGSILSYLTNGQWNNIYGYETGSLFAEKTYFENPYLFLREHDGGGFTVPPTYGAIKKWNLNCLTPGYTTVQTVSGSLRCTDGNYIESPNNENPETILDIPAIPSELNTNATFPYTGTGGAGTNITCSNKQYTSPLNTTWYTDFGTLTETVWDGASNVEGGLGFQDTENNGLDTDYFRGTFFASGSYVPHGVMLWGNSSPVANVEYLDSRITPLSNKDPKIRIISKRNGILRDFNIIQVSSTGGELGATFGEFGTYNGAIAEPFPTAIKVCTNNGDNTCTIVSDRPAKYSDLHISSGLTGLRFGLSTDSENRVACRNDSYQCKRTYTASGGQAGDLTKFSGNWRCDGITLNTTIDNGQAFISGDCGIDSSGYCVPIASYRNPGAFEHNLYDSGGNVIGVAPGAFPGDTSTQTQIVDDIFSCPQYEDWTDFPACVLQVFKNGYGLITRSINQGTSDSSNTMVGTLKKIGSGSTTQNFGVWSESGVNIVDNMYRKTWNKAFDTNEPLTQFSRTAFFGALMMIILAIILTIVFIGTKKS